MEQIKKERKKVKSTWVMKVAECVGDLKLKRIKIRELPTDHSSIGKSTCTTSRGAGFKS